MDSIRQRIDEVTQLAIHSLSLYRLSVSLSNRALDQIVEGLHEAVRLLEGADKKPMRKRR